VFVTNPSGKVYAYENTSYWDKEAKKTKHIRKCVGHVDPTTGKIVPNHRKVPKGESTENKFCSVSGIGVSLLLDHVTDSTGLKKVLKNAFPDDWQQIMTCAYHLVSEGTALSRAERWTAANRTPFGKVLTSQRISDLLVRITPEAQFRFFSKWIEHNRSNEYYAMDVTSVSSYSEIIEFVRYGYNRDKNKLPQVNLLLVSGETSRIPLFYKVLPGSINDVNTLRGTLDTLELINAKKLHLVMDKGFYSEANVNAMYNKRIRFLVGVPFTVGYANELVKKVQTEGIRSPENFRMVFDDEIYMKYVNGRWNGHRCHAHVYFDSLKAELENRKLDRLLYNCYKELETDKTCDEHRAYYKKFFIISDTPKRGRKIQYNQLAIDEHKENTTGWFVLISNDIKCPVKALETYRLKDTAEKAFDDLKNDLDCRRLRIHSSQAMDGRLFIQFVALVLSTNIKVIMNEAGWYRNHDMQQIIDEMKSLREVRMEGQRKRIVSTPTAFQQKIIQLFGLIV
jgi:hypothetical protein